MRVVTFGEVMLRMMPAGWLRLSQALPGSMDVTFGGAEVNVAVSISKQGGQAAFCTALPDNPLTDAFTAQIKSMITAPTTMPNKKLCIMRTPCYRCMDDPMHLR